MKLEEKFKAIELRRLGYSYGNILNEVKVSKSTLSLWLKDIDLTPDQVRELIKGRDLSRYIAAQKKKSGTKEKIKNIRAEAAIELKKLITNPLFLSGLMLYWAEGDKHNKERVKFTNSDANMIMLMMKWFREICLVPETKFRIALHIHDLHIRDDVLDYWSKLTNIPESQFHRPYIKATSLRQRKNILYNGTCAIVVSDVKLFRKIHGWRDALLHHFGIVLQPSPCSSTDRTRDF